MRLIAIITYKNIFHKFVFEFNVMKYWNYNIILIYNINMIKRVIFINWLFFTSIIYKTIAIAFYKLHIYIYTTYTYIQNSFTKRFTLQIYLIVFILFHNNLQLKNCWINYKIISPCLYICIHARAHTHINMQKYMYIKKNKYKIYIK